MKENNFSFLLVTSFVIPFRHCVHFISLSSAREKSPNKEAIHLSSSSRKRINIFCLFTKNPRLESYISPRSISRYPSKLNIDQLQTLNRKISTKPSRHPTTASKIAITTYHSDSQLSISSIMSTTESGNALQSSAADDSIINPAFVVPCQTDTEPASRNHTAGEENFLSKPTDESLSLANEPTSPRVSPYELVHSPTLSQSCLWDDDDFSVKTLESSSGSILSSLSSLSSTSSPPPSPSSRAFSTPPPSPHAPDLTQFRPWDINGVYTARTLYFTSSMSVTLIQMQLEDFGWRVSQSTTRKCLGMEE